MSENMKEERYNRKDKTRVWSKAGRIVKNVGNIIVMVIPVAVSIVLNKKKK
jgi:hypothetical protein